MVTGNIKRSIRAATDAGGPHLCRGVHRRSSVTTSAVGAPAAEHQ